MIRRGVAAGDRFVQVLNAAVQDERLSYRARGILASVLSRPRDWRGSSTALAAGSPREGQGAVLTALKELEEFGYLQRRKFQGPDGRWSTSWSLTDDPALHDPVEPQPDEPGPDDAEEECRPDTPADLANPQVAPSGDYRHSVEPDSADCDLSTKYVEPNTTTTRARASEAGPENGGGGSTDDRPLDPTDAHASSLWELLDVVKAVLPPDAVASLHRPTVERELRRLAGAGWSRESFRAAMAARGWDGAGPGVFVSWLRGLERPVRVSTATVPRPRCPDCGGLAPAGVCPVCSQAFMAPPPGLLRAAVRS